MALDIRPYEPADRPALRRICIATGLRGRLDFVEPELFADLWLNPYLLGEPEEVLVATDAGEPIGYLVGSVKPGFERRALRCARRPLGRLVGSLVTGRYRHHAPSRRFARWLLGRLWRETPRHPAGYAHCHFNLAEGYRGRGLGERLVEGFEERVAELGLPGWYGILFSADQRRSVRLYEKLGFRLYDERPCSLFDEPVRFLCVVKDRQEVSCAA